MAFVGNVPKEPQEEKSVDIDYANSLVSGETITSAIVTSIRVSDQSDSTTDIVSGSYTISGSKIFQDIKGGGHGEIHILRILGVTDATPNPHKYQGDVRIIVNEVARES